MSMPAFGFKVMNNPRRIMTGCSLSEKDPRGLGSLKVSHEPTQGCFRSECHPGMEVRGTEFWPTEVVSLGYGLRLENYHFTRNTG